MEPVSVSHPSTAMRARRFRIPGTVQLETIANRFSAAERLLFYIFSILLVGTTLMLLGTLNSYVTTAEPSHGGSLTEGLVGTPRFINPVLAISDADRDLSLLVYSGLMRATQSGDLIPDLATGYEVSENGTVYTFTISPDAVFHDGTPVTAKDVIFTVAKAQDPDSKSPKRANWEGVVAEAIDDHTVRFTLPKPYAPFLENTTIGILPAHLWEQIPADQFPFHALNTAPIGSGPYRVKSTKTDSTGTPTRYVLTAFRHFTLGQPFINKITLRFYANEDALIAAFRRNEVDAAAGISSNLVADLETRSDIQVLHTTLPRVFAVFFNQNQATLFLSEPVRQALDRALDKQGIINTALAGFGTVLDGPIPPGTLATDTVTVSLDETPEERIAAARGILENDGWTRNEETGIYGKKGSTLSFALTTADTPELSATAEAIAATWRELGADVSVKVFSTGSINVNVIRPRQYDALLFGEIVGRTLDLFAFWHSSQRADPGLNLALYTNAKADTILSDARADTDRESREASYRKFAQIVADDHPASFIYAPEFVYAVPKKIRGIELGALSTGSERFLNVYQWHVETERVWNFLATTK